MITRSKIVSVWYGIIYVSVVLSLLGRLTMLFVGFTEKNIMIPIEHHSGKKITVNFSLENVTCEGNEVAAYSNEIISATDSVPGSENRMMYTTLEVDRHCTKWATASCLAEGAKVRIVAYLGKTTYYTHADYTVASGMLTSDEPLQVYPGSYKFNVYSYNSPSLPVHNDYSISDTDFSNEFLWGCYPENGTYIVTESTSKAIPITMSHKIFQEECPTVEI